MIHSYMAILGPYNPMRESNKKVHKTMQNLRMDNWIKLGLIFKTQQKTKKKKETLKKERMNSGEKGF